MLLYGTLLALAGFVDVRTTPTFSYYSGIEAMIPISRLPRITVTVCHASRRSARALAHSTQRLPNLHQPLLQRIAQLIDIVQVDDLLERILTR
jgi:hypothetical protein